MELKSWNILQYGKLTLKFIKYIGFCCYTIDENYEVTITLKNAILFFTNLIIILTTFAYSWIRIDVKNSSIILLGIQWTQNLVILIAILSIIQTFVMHKPFWKNFVRFHEIDLKVK
jgi:hypothetical protein